MISLFDEYVLNVVGHLVDVKIEEGGLNLFYFSFHFFFLFNLFFYFSIFRTTRVRVDLSHCHISHLMA